MYVARPSRANSVCSAIGNRDTPTLLCSQGVVTASSGSEWVKRLDLELVDSIRFCANRTYGFLLRLENERCAVVCVGLFVCSFVLSFVFCL